MEFFVIIIGHFRTPMHIGCYFIFSHIHIVPYIVCIGKFSCAVQTYNSHVYGVYAIASGMVEQYESVVLYTVTHNVLNSTVFCMGNSHAVYSANLFFLFDNFPSVCININPLTAVRCIGIHINFIRQSEIAVAARVVG